MACPFRAFSLPLSSSLRHRPRSALRPTRSPPPPPPPPPTVPLVPLGAPLSSSPPTVSLEEAEGTAAITMLSVVPATAMAAETTAIAARTALLLPLLRLLRCSFLPCGVSSRPWSRRRQGSPTSRFPALPSLPQLSRPPPVCLSLETATAAAGASASVGGFPRLLPRLSAGLHPAISTSPTLAASQLRPLQAPFHPRRHQQVAAVPTATATATATTLSSVVVLAVVGRIQRCGEETLGAALQRP